MDDEEDVDEIKEGDSVWWQRGENVPGWTPQPPPEKYYAPGFKPVLTIKYEDSVLTGRVRSLGFEEPDYRFASVETFPDGRIILVALSRLVKGTPGGPAPDPDPELDRAVWGDALP